MNNKALPLSIVKISGKDSLIFLQGQLTQDMSSLDKKWNYAAQCNPQGRVISFFIAFQWEKEFYLLIGSNNASNTIEQLQKYVMLSDVSFETLDLNVFFIAQDAVKETEKEIDKTIVKNNGNFHLQQKSGELIIKPEPHGDAQNSNDWKIANIKNLVPDLNGKALGNFTPEAINLDLLGAISFTKGCYTGQEIVARMHYLGKAKKRLFKATLQGSLDSTKAGDKISDIEGKTIGKLVDFEPTGHCLISIKSTLNGTLARNKFCIQAVNGELML